MGLTSLIDWLYPFDTVLRYARYGVSVQSPRRAEHIFECGAVGVTRDEATLLRRAQQRDPAAWAELFDQFYPRVYAFILTRVRDHMLAEDLAADVFVNALRAIASYEDRGLGLISWLFRIAQNRIIDHLRRSVPRTPNHLDDFSEQLADPQASPIRSENLDLRTALERLSPDQRQVIHLRFVEDMTSAQVAHVIGKSEGAVKIIQHRALKSLKQWMRKTH